MAKSDVTSLVTTLSMSQDNTTETSIIYDEVVRELGFLEVLTDTETIAVSSGTSVYAVGADTIVPLELYTSQGFLSRADGKTLGSVYGSDWRNRSGSPVNYTMDTENDNTFRLIPNPKVDDTLTVIHTEYRQDVPVWLELPIAFEVTSREFERGSDHQDLKFSATCKSIANLLFLMVGVQRGK